MFFGYIILTTRRITPYLTKDISGSSLGVILPRGDIWQCLEIIFHSCGGSYWHLVGTEGRSAAKHPTAHGAVPHNKHSQATDVDSTKIGKPWKRFMQHASVLSTVSRTRRRPCGMSCTSPLWGIPQPLSPPESRSFPSSVPDPGPASPHQRTPQRLPEPGQERDARSTASKSSTDFTEQQL